MEEKDARERARYRRLVRSCGRGRTGLRLLAGGAVAAVVAGAGFLGFMVSLTIGSGIRPLLWLATAGLAAHFAATAAGFSFCGTALPALRNMAAAGAACTLAQAAAAGLTAYDVTRSGAVGGVGGKGNPELFLAAAMQLGCVYDNLLAVVLLPFAVAIGLALPGQVPLPVSALAVPMAAGAVEFAKLSLVGLVANRAAVEAKAPRAGLDAMRFVHRIFLLVLVGAVLFPLAIPVGFLLADTLQFSKAGGGLVAVVLLPVGMLINLYFALWTGAWVAQAQALRDVAEVLLADRVTYPGDDLEAA